MKIVMFILLLMSLSIFAQAQKETEILPEAIVLPRLTKGQRNALSAKEGMMIYNKTTDKVNIYNGIGWQDYTGPSLWVRNGNRIYYHAGNVGIGVSKPKTKFHIANNQRVLWGTDTLGNGDKLMFLPDLHAFRVGTVSAGAASTYWNRDSIGLYSFASGYNTRAQGLGGTAMGRDTEATNSYAFASGYFTNADGQYSTAMGFNTDASATGSTALGYSSDAEANYTFAAGHSAEAQAIYSVAIGNHTRAQAHSCMAIGGYNVGGGSATNWISTDPIFEIGIGSGPSTRANAMTVRKNGNVGIGTRFPTATLQVIGTTRIGSAEELTDGGSYLLDFDATLRPVSNNARNLGNSAKRWNTVYATNGTINTSDRRLKKHIEAIPYGLSEILKLNPVQFEWIDGHQNKAKLGLIAQEVLPIINEVVNEYENFQLEESTQYEKSEVAFLGINYGDLIPVLIKGIQDQQAIVISLKNEITKNKHEINQLKSTIATLDSLIKEHLNK